MTVNIGWPEGIMLSIYALSLLIDAGRDGEPKTGTHKFAVTLCGAIIGLGLLYWGGFFA